MLKLYPTGNGGEVQAFGTHFNVNAYADEATINTTLLEGSVKVWKNGLFSFNASNIKTVMQQISRWYDAEVVYAGDVKETFFVKMSRNTNVSNVFKILETTGGVHFEIDGKKITVKSLVLLVNLRRSLLRQALQENRDSVRGGTSASSPG